MLNLVNKPKLVTVIPTQVTTLSVSWLNNQFKAVAVHRGVVAGSWERPGETGGPETFEDLISEAVQQTARVSMASSAEDPALDGDYCSGFGKSCSSAANRWGEDLVWEKPAEYSIHLTAPLGQGWIGAPTDCGGVGTDNLTCVFTAKVATPYFLF